MSLLRGKERQHLNEKELQAVYENIGREIIAATSDIPKETATQKRHRLERLAKSPMEQVLWYLPHLFEHEPHKGAKQVFSPKIALALFAYLLTIWPRGWAKSMYLDIGMPLVRDFAGLMKCAAMIGINDHNARILLMDVQAEYEFNERIHYDYGPQKIHGNWAGGEFQTKRGLWMKSLGMGGNVKGWRRGKFRLDAAFMDDFDNAKKSRNPQLVAQDVSWVKQDLWGAASPERFFFAAMQNLFSEGQVQYQLREDFKTLRNDESWDKDWKLLVSYLEAFDKNGESTWPQVWSTRQLKQKQLLMAGEFGKNYLHNTDPIGAEFKEEYLPWVKPLPRNQYDMIVTFHDQAFTETGDHNAIVTVGRKGNHFHILECFLEQCHILVALDWLYQLYFRWKEECKSVVMHVRWEELPIDVLLQDYKDQMDEKYGTVLPIGGVKHTTGKLERILELLPLAARKLIGFSEEQRNNPSMVKLRRQFMGVQKGSSVPDDGPDAVRGAITELLDRKPTQRQKSGGVMVGRADNPFF